MADEEETASDAIAKADAEPTAMDFLLNWPLYRAVAVTEDSSLEALLRDGAVQFDAFCTRCGKPSTFKKNAT